MFKVVKKRDFVRMKTNFKDHFMITNHGAPEGVYLSVERMKMLPEDELTSFLYEVFTHLGVINGKTGT